mgnify:CR=1 FL=1
MFFKQVVVAVAGNGGGSGGVISVYLEDRLRFNGRIEAVGGSGHLGGGPGSVLARTAVGSDVFTEIWIDNVNRGNVDSCDYPTKLVNIVSVDVLHLQKKACAKSNVSLL